MKSDRVVFPYPCGVYLLNATLKLCVSLYVKRFIVVVNVKKVHRAEECEIEKSAAS